MPRQVSGVSPPSECAMFVLFRGDGTRPHALTGTRARAELAGDIWATILALQLKNSMPFDCILNPQAPALAQVSMQAQATMWLDEQLYAYPPLEGCMDTVWENAKVCVKQWTDAFVEDIEELRDMLLNPPALAEADVKEGDAKEGEGERKELSTIDAVVKAKVIAGTMAEGVTPVVKKRVKHARIKAALLKASRTVKYGRSKLLFVVKSHPLGAIAMSPLSDPFTRADKLLVQVRPFFPPRFARRVQTGPCATAANENGFARRSVQRVHCDAVDGGGVLLLQVRALLRGAGGALRVRGDDSVG